MSQARPASASKQKTGELVFADFNGDGKTDIARTHNGKWQVSWCGTTPWKPLSTGRMPPITQMLLGEFSSQGRADVLQYRGLERYKLSNGGTVPLFTWSQQDALAQTPRLKMGTTFEEAEPT